MEVFRLISAGSIEENIYLRQIYKQVALPSDSVCVSRAKLTLRLEFAGTLVHLVLLQSNVHGMRCFSRSSRL